MSPRHSPPTSRAEAFGAFVSAAARDAGYDIDSPRGGGKKALAEAAGMSHASVSRMLAGISLPDPVFFEALARALNVSLGELLVRSGLVSEGASITTNPATGDMTAEVAARALGLRDPRSISMFQAMVENLRDQEEQFTDEPRRRSA
ncbi:helix-turn-helix transcriptional regulator [Streptomyces sp. Z26]|uniref:helix-turn-helix domain-containing protein n=1 Tax=Streptomyces sp. Z26 TaxID=2500177 RepID=UPI000EF133C0|nr:helix-turn-helix transcriptional regulator [Streptomyces sp. Z26]RLL68168.1 XRE family transcriptional regulator [Streptomyces sp. Z26]